MKIFAMIDGQQVGPMELENVAEAGVRPDTYVWCKGMPDWQKASEVPDICRFFRLRLAGVIPSCGYDGGMSQQQKMLDYQAEQEELISRLPPMARHLVRKSGVRLTKDNLPQPSEQQESKWFPIVIYSICTVLIIIGFLLLRL
ncbi:MAG: DUF4339 domain-containing protein [Muribaculum sp.]|nr:DUF4339 domain-containing protein [Muribaculum sp.]